MSFLFKDMFEDMRLKDWLKDIYNSNVNFPVVIYMSRRLNLIRSWMSKRILEHYLCYFWWIFNAILDTIYIPQTDVHIAARSLYNLIGTSTTKQNIHMVKVVGAKFSWYRIILRLDNYTLKATLSYIPSFKMFLYLHYDVFPASLWLQWNCIFSST